MEQIERRGFLSRLLFALVGAAPAASAAEQLVNEQRRSFFTFKSSPKPEELRYADLERIRKDFEPKTLGEYLESRPTLFGRPIEFVPEAGALAPGKEIRFGAFAEMLQASPWDGQYSAYLRGARIQHSDDGKNWVDVEGASAGGFLVPDDIRRAMIGPGRMVRATVVSAPALIPAKVEFYREPRGFYGISAGDLRIKAERGQAVAVEPCSKKRPRHRYRDGSAERWFCQECRLHFWSLDDVARPLCPECRCHRTTYDNKTVELGR